MTVPSFLVWLIGLYVVGKILKGLWPAIRFLVFRVEGITNTAVEAVEPTPPLTDEEMAKMNCKTCLHFQCTHDVTPQGFMEETKQGTEPYCNWVYYDVNPAAVESQVYDMSVMH